MRRGTTPDYLLSIPGYDLSECKVYVTVQQYANAITLTSDRLEIEVQDDTTSISFRLTQAETLQFKSGNAEVQVRFIDSEGTAQATDIGRIDIMPILYEDVIEYGNTTNSGNIF